MLKYVILLLAVWSVDANNDYLLFDYEAYYWKDFNGVVPSDAFPAGKYKNNENIYIVQVLHKDLIIPGRLDEHLQQAEYEYGNKKWSTTENVKILCTKLPHLFEWHASRSSSFKVYSSYINGGYEPNKFVFIGRGVKDEEILVGKVVGDLRPSVLLHTTQGNNSVTLKHYEVLSYRPTYVNNSTVSNLKSTSNNPAAANDVYYWREFIGRVPFDAFSAGVGNKSIYIVQVPYKELLIPGVLDNYNQFALFEYDGKQRYSEGRTRILCTNDPGLFQWVNNDNCLLFKSDKSIIGGYEENRSVFIGRGVQDEEFLVGRVVADGKTLPLLHTLQNQKSVILRSYEVLTYRLPNDNTSICSTVLTTMEDSSMISKLDKTSEN